MVEVSGISRQTTEMLEILQYNHILLGTRLEVRKKFPFDDSLEVKVRNRPPVTISAQVAKNVLVKDDPLPTPHGPEKDAGERGPAPVSRRDRRGSKKIV
jgi:hypothetical protein